MYSLFKTLEYKINLTKFSLRQHQPNCCLSWVLLQFLLLDLYRVSLVALNPMESSMQSGRPVDC